MEKPITRRLASYSRVAEKVELNRITLWRLIGAGRFPKPLKIPGAGRSSIVRFDLDEVDAWIERHKAERDAEQIVVKVAA